MLYELLTSDDYTNIELALQLKHQFSKEEWFDSLEKIADNCFNGEKFNYFQNYRIEDNELWIRPIGGWYLRDIESLCELHKNSLKIKYKGDTQLKKIFRKFEFNLSIFQTKNKN